MIIVARNLLHAVLFLILSFIGVAGLYITLSADFVAVAQVLIYAGAIAVLMIFAIMLTPLSDRGNTENYLRAPALVICGLFVTVITFVVLKTDWRLAGRGPFDTTATAIGEALIDPFVLPFEIASVLLTAAMIGAIVLVREDD
jgi:NADH-quinone oxidoreductase subunit J